MTKGKEIVRAPQLARKCCPAEQKIQFRQTGDSFSFGLLQWDGLMHPVAILV